MRRSAGEKMEIIRLVEHSDLPVRATLRQLGLASSTFYGWYQRHLEGGPEALEDRKPRPRARWNKTIGGRNLSLKSLEEKVVRRRFMDPRVHAALNCASISCPRLPQEAFHPERLDEQLDAAMSEFVSEARNVTVEPSGCRRSSTGSSPTFSPTRECRDTRAPR